MIGYQTSVKTALAHTVALIAILHGVIRSTLMMHQTVVSTLQWLTNKRQVHRILSKPFSPNPVMLLMTLLVFFVLKY